MSNLSGPYVPLDPAPGTRNTTNSAPFPPLSVQLMGVPSRTWESPQPVGSSWPSSHHRRWMLFASRCRRYQYQFPSRKSNVAIPNSNPAVVNTLISIDGSVLEIPHPAVGSV